MEQILHHVRTQHQQYLDELSSYLAIPSISSDPEYSGDVADCAQHTADLLIKAGLENVKVNRTSGHPIVTGEWLKAPGKPTVLIYGHYDVQPVDPLELWEKEPFTAHVKNDRIIARGSADDKGQVFMHIKVVEAFNKITGGLPVNVKFIIEGEEEIASPSLTTFLSENREQLAADIALVSDTSMHSEGMPAITYGLRGLSYLEVELTGPDHDLHSGEYGGAVANPAEILTRILGRVKDNDGRIQIPGFYDSVKELTPAEREILTGIPFDAEEYKTRVGVDELWGESTFSPLEQTGVRPTFEINGIWGGFTGHGAKTVLPSKASAKISCRLVPDQDPDEISKLVESYIRDKAPGCVKVKVVHFTGGKPASVPLDNPYIKVAARALYEAFDKEALFLRGGGSIPIIAGFKEVLGLDTLLMGFCLPDCRAHSPNENMHLPSFFTGIESLVRMMHMLGEM